MVLMEVRASLPVFIGELCVSNLSDVRPLIRMSPKIPAWLHSGMRKQRIHARLGPWWIEEELGLAVLLQDGIVVADDNRSIRFPIRGHPQTKKLQVNQKDQDCRPCGKKKHREENAPYPLPEVERHEARL